MTTLFSEESISELRKIINSKVKSVIVTHVNPDGDAIGSSLAWCYFLRNFGVPVTVIVPNQFPDFLKWMNGSDDIVIYNSNKEKAKNILKEADILYCLDFNNIGRLDDLGDFISTLSFKHILIDHHLAPPPDFHLSFSYIPISSTSEIVYRIIDALGETKLISKYIAEDIYTGIITDTGMFNHSCSDSELFVIVSKLMKYGIDKTQIHSKVYNNFSVDRMHLLGYTLYEKMKIIPELNTAYIYLTNKELDKFNFQAGDTEGFVNLPLSIKGIKLSAFFSESREGFIKISFRSIGDFSVNNLARKHFNGGGHKNASGGKVFTSIEETITKFENILEEYKEELRDSI